MELEDMLKSKKQFSVAEIAEIIQLAKASGRTSFFTVIDDPNSPEAKAATDYLKGHCLLPENYLDTPVEEIDAKGKKLLEPGTAISEKKEILMLLAHLGVYESFRVLKEYRKNPDPELRTWAKMAYEECNSFVQQSFSTEEMVFFSQIRTTNRNAPCPCGSGKKFKKCCGKKF